MAKKTHMSPDKQMFFWDKGREQSKKTSPGHPSTLNPYTPNSRESNLWWVGWLNEPVKIITPKGTFMYRGDRDAISKFLMKLKYFLKDD